MSASPTSDAFMYSECPPTPGALDFTARREGVWGAPSLVFSTVKSWGLKGYPFHADHNGLILPLRNIDQMRLIGTAKYQRGGRVKILAETESLVGWREGDVLVQLYDEERNAVVLVKREEYERWVRR